MNKVAYFEIGVHESVKCENRLGNDPGEEEPDQRPDEKQSVSSDNQYDEKKAPYDAAILPIADLIRGDEITIVPDGPLFFAPFAAFKDQLSKYFSERFRIRLFPTLSTLKLMAECHEKYHSNTGVLLVGDPWVGNVRTKGKTPSQLPNAEKEVEMIGGILNTEPLTSKRATKAEVLHVSRLSSVALVHIAAHGKAETGEILLSPNPTQ